MKKLLLIALILYASNSMASSLPDCPSDPSVRWHNCFGTINLKSGSTYVGEWRDDKRNGQGTFTWANGENYVGEFKDGKSHGQGTYTYADGDKYIGEFKDTKKHGQGAYTYATGNKYVGEYKDDAMHGKGTFSYANGVEERGYHMNDEYVPTICENMGLKKGSDPFGQCVVSLINEINKDD